MPGDDGAPPADEYALVLQQLAEEKTARQAAEQKAATAAEQRIKLPDVQEFDGCDIQKHPTKAFVTNLEVFLKKTSEKYPTKDYRENLKKTL